MHKENYLLETNRRLSVSMHFTVLRKSLVALYIGVKHSLLLKDILEVNSWLFTMRIKAIHW